MKLSLIHADVMAGLKSIPSESVDLCITSPPYWGLRSYGVDGELGAEPTLEKYLDNLMAWTNEVFRVLKPSGSFVLNLGGSYCGGGRAGSTHKDLCKGTKFEKTNVNQQKGLSLKGLKGFYKPRQFIDTGAFAYCRIISETDFVNRNRSILCKTNVPSPIRSRLKQSTESMDWFVKDANKNYWNSKPWMKTVKNYGKKQRRHSINNKLPDTFKKTGRPDENGFFKINNPETIEHNWRVVSVGEKQKGFEIYGGFKDAKRLEKKLFKKFFEEFKKKFLVQGLTEEEATKKANKKASDKSFEKTKEKYPEYVKQIHIAPFPEHWIKPWIISLCPDKVCKKCGKPMKIISKRIGKTFERTHVDHGHFRQQVGNAYDNGTPATYKLIEEIQCSCNAGFEPGTVLDPFVGSGTTMKVARDLGLSCIGIDLDVGALDYAKQRVNWGVGLETKYKDSELSCVAENKKERRLNE